MSAKREQHTIVATCAGGLEPVLEREIRSLPGTELEAGEPGIVRFRGSTETIILANRCLRTASRVLLPLRSGQARRYDDVYALAKQVPWERWIAADYTFAVTAITRSKTLSNHKFLAMRVKDALVDRQRDKLGRRSNVERKRRRLPGGHPRRGRGSRDLSGHQRTQPPRARLPPGGRRGAPARKPCRRHGPAFGLGRHRPALRPLLRLRHNCH